MASNTKYPKDSTVEMTEVIMPQHTNPLGSVFGGVVLSWVDTAAAIAAQRHSGMVVVTASIDSMHFLAPIRLGWIASIKASVNYTASTSCEVGVKIFAENPRKSILHHTSSAYVTMVSLNSSGEPTKMPIIKPESETEKRRYQQAVERRRARLELRKAVDKKS